jgi:hypothetical protein
MRGVRVAHAARAPDMQWHTFADQRTKRLIELRWFHLDLPQSEYWLIYEEKRSGITVNV